MAGIGDSWGTAQELLHPRDSHGRFRTKWKMSPSVLAAVENVLQAFRPRTFQSDGQAAQYNFNLASRKPGRFGGGKGFARLQADYHAANEDLRDGNIDDPSTRKFVDMMDQAAIDLPDDAIISRVVGPDAFGLTPEQLPQLEEMTGNVIADRGYGAANIGTPLGGGQGLITMVMATPKGTKMIVPGRNRNDRAMFYDRDQEFTITKVKPDGRGGYTVYAVATPKTPGQTPVPENVGHQGPGISPNREAAVKALENASAKREMGAQPPGQAPPGASGPIPHTGGTPEEQRAAQRAQVLGRPTGPNATPETQQQAVVPPAPTPATPVPTSTPAAAPNVPAAPAPQAPAAPEAPSGVTSVVTGTPATSFREAAQGLESPSAGPRRREWNSAYQGVVSGKQHPQDMLRELEADITNNKEIQKTEPGLGDSVLAHDIQKQEKLADLIRSHFNLGEPVQRQPRQEVRNELQAKAAKAAKASLLRPGGGTEKTPPGKKSAIEAAQPTPLAKVAPKRAGTPQERAKALGTQREQDLKDNQLNAEQRTRWSDQVGKEPASLTPDNASSILLDETADQLRNGRTTRAKAVDRLREQARDQNTPEADYLRKVADVIEADTSKPAKRVPLKKAAPKAPPNVAAAEASLEGRSEKNILTGLNKLSVGDMRAVAEKWGISTRGEDKKLKLKAVLAKELAAHWKATPELQRKKEGGVPGAPSTPTISAEDQLASAKAAVARLGRPGGMKAAAPAKAPPLSPGEKALAEAKASVAKIGAPKTPAAKALTQIAESPGLPPELKKAAKKAAVKKPRTELTKAERDANLPELSSRVLAGESANTVINDIRSRHGLAPQAPVEAPAAIPSDPLGQAREAKLVKDLKTIAEDNNLTIKGRPTKEALRAEIIRQLEEKGGAPAAPTPTPTSAPETKIPGIDTAERARLQARAKEVLAEMQNKPAADPWEQMAKDLGGTQVSKDLVARAKKITEEVKRTSGPSGISVEDRVAARLLSSVKPEYRQGILDEMSPADRKHMLDIAERVAAEDARVKKSGHDLDQILSDAGLKVPTDREALPAYNEVKHFLAENKMEAAKKALTDELRRVDFGLESLRRTAGDKNAPTLQREYAGKEITNLLARSEWLRSVAGALHGGSTTSPELVPKKQIQQVIKVHSPELMKSTPEELKQAAESAGIKLPEAATTRDEILTEMAREVIRRDQAGNPIDFPAPKVPAKKTKAPVEHHRVDARTLVPGQGWDEGETPQGTGVPSDKKMLDRVQGLLDGNPDDIANAGLGRAIPTPAAVGRYLDSWTNGASGPGAKAAMNVVPLDGAMRRLKDAKTPEEVKHWQQKVKEAEDTRDQLRAQTERWRTLAAKLKATRRTPVKKTATPAPEAPAIKETLARAAKSAPAKEPTPDVVANLSGLNNDELKKITESPSFNDGQKAIVAKELARRTEAVSAPTPPKAPAKAALPGTSIGADNRLIREARDRKKQADEDFRRAEAKVANLDPELDNPDAAQWEDDLDTARDERDAADEDLANLLDRVRAKNAAPPAVEKQVAKQVAKKAARKEVQAEVAKKPAPVKTLSRSGHDGLDVTNQEERDFLTLPGEQQDAILERIRTRAGRSMRDTNFGTVPDSQLVVSSKREADIRAAVEAIAARKSGSNSFVTLQQIREDLGDRFSRAEVDHVLQKLNRSGDWLLSPEANQKVLTPRARLAAVTIGNADKHALRVMKHEPGPAKVAKKVAPTAVNPSGNKKYTDAELQDMSLGDLVDIENERGIKRVSVAKADRIQAILDQQNNAAVATPAKKVAKAVAAPTTTPAPGKPGPAVRNASNRVTNGADIVKRDRPNNDQPIYLPNRGQDQGMMHLDSEMGKLWADLYMDDREPNSFVNEIARMGDEMGQHRLGLDKFIERLKEMKKKAADSAIADRIQEAIDSVDAPPVKLDLPSDTPPVLRKAFEDLAAIPTARISVPAGKKGERAPLPRRVGNASFHAGDPSVVQKKEDILRRLIAGDPEFLRGRAAADLLANRDLHEGADAATTMWRIMEKAVQDPTVKAWLREKTAAARKKAGQ